MWGLPTLNALNEAAVKVGERQAFKEVGITPVPENPATVGECDNADQKPNDSRLSEGG